MSNRRRFLGRGVLITAGLTTAGMRRDRVFGAEPPAFNPPPPLPFNEQVADVLAKTRRANSRVPGMVAAIVRNNQVVGIAAEGVRRLDMPERIEVTDRFHMGSNTKAMTATMIGTLIDSKRLRWDSTLGSTFPAYAAAMHPAYRAVTLDQLLEHRAGLPANIDWSAVEQGIAPTFQRRSILFSALARPPRSKPGTKFEYSNVGFALAGLMAEEVTATPWEILMNRIVFGPLGMTSVGYGPPGSPLTVDEPWGHKRVGPGLTPTWTDNPAVMGPAATVHVTMGDWAKFASFHLGDGTIAGTGRRLLSPETFAELHTPAPGNNYAGGWLISNRGRRGDGPVWEHAGSNTFWYAIIKLFPSQKFGVLTACNAGEPVGDSACKQTVAALQALEPLTRK